MTKYTQVDHEQYREQVEKEEREREEAATREQQRHTFLAAGGRDEDFPAEYEEGQKEQVRQTVKRREEAARAHQQAISRI
jgi:hypothetical protein